MITITIIYYEVHGYALPGDDKLSLLELPQMFQTRRFSSLELEITI